MEAGTKLLQPPSSVDELLHLLDQVENFLSRVEQSPPTSMHNALSPLMKALVANELLRHLDVDVKVAVASCISEITRITAPDTPYDDDKMKDIFQLIVSSFENLSDESSRSYNKRTLILETVAKHFLKAIRDYHAENIFSSMETIMTLVLEESEDISLELLSPILASVKNDNEEFLPIARKLGEKVFENCAIKLKPCLTHAVKSLGFSLEDYSKVVASICEGTTGTVEHNVHNAPGEQLADESKLARASSEEAAQASLQADESKLATASSDEAAQVAKKGVTEEASPGEVNPTIDRSPKLVMSNGVAETGNEGTSLDPESLKKPEHGHHANQSVNNSETSKVEPDDSDTGKLVISESKPERTSKRRGRKLNSSINSTEPSESSRVDSEKETERLTDRRKSRSKDVSSSPGKDTSVEASVPLENEKETGVQLSSPKVSESEAVNVASPSPSERLPDEIRSKKVGRPKRKENLIQEALPSADVSKRASEGTSDSELKPQKRSGKKTPARISNEDKTPAAVDKSKNEGGTTSDSEAKPPKHSGKKTDASNNIDDGSSLKKKEDGKRRGKGKATSEKDGTKSTAKDDDKEIVSSPKSTIKLAKDEGHIEETPKTISKRKHTPGKEKASEIVEFGENLVGSKVKVWWPKDQMFYEGVIYSFDHVKKKHMVLYTDGDEETLNLRKERWEIIVGDSDSLTDGEQETEQPSPDASSDMHKKKKAKKNPEPSAKRGKMEVSPKRGGGASSGKLKVAATKSGRKSKDDNKAGKSKEVDGGTVKASTKSKQDTPKTTTKDTPKTVGKSKAKTPKGGDKSNANGTGKAKSTLSKVKENEYLKERPPDSMKTPESAKGKSLDTSKARESESKSGKKRRRGVNN
ncbi:hypothetical protein F0562_007502 [Nyssa sinensis]|uniref:Tudor domain-containing protein n=1 Tax=Nyssa sinensis TaxID=561372 RepID=A0A5J5A6P8_9ASTE|nr:hypothetical protein F0562_007502 [Nyssa sinensis]